MPDPAPHSLPADRGAGWVAVQSVLLLSLVLAGPGFPGTWHAPAGVALGVVLFAAGGALGVAGVVHLGPQRTPFPRPVPGAVLVERGVYGWIRHPLYTCLALVGAGWTLLWQSGMAAAVTWILAVFLHAKARREERWLLAELPGYADYARRVRRYVPGLF